MKVQKLALVITLGALLLVLMGALVLGAAAQAPLRSASTNDGDGPPTLRFAVLIEQTTTNVWAIYDTHGGPANDAQKALYPGLYRYSDHGFALVPYLAAGFPSDVSRWVHTGSAALR